MGPAAETLEQQRNRSVAEQLPKAVQQRRWRLAIALHLRPYDGQPHRCPEELYRSQAKSGTTHFHAYASCYIVHQGHRYTVALTRVEKGTALVAVLQRLLRGASRAGVRPQLLLLDRGFYSVAVIRYLQAARYPFIMPVIGRGRKPTHPQDPSGTHGFAAQPHSGWFTYTRTSATKLQATVGLCGHCQHWRGRRRRHGRQPLS